jgi:hypothetical protein
MPGALTRGFEFSLTSSSIRPEDRASLLGRKPWRAQKLSPHRLPHTLQDGFSGLKDSICTTPWWRGRVTRMLKGR